MKPRISDSNEQVIRQGNSNPDEYFITIAVKPNSAQNRIQFDGSDFIQISITAPPTKGKANKAILKFIAKKLKISSGNVSLISGMTQSTKIIKIRMAGVNASDIKNLLIR